MISEFLECSVIISSSQITKSQIAFFSELFFEKKVRPQTFDSSMYMVLGGLGFTASEKFIKKDEKK